jgi:hypothetical protein
MMGYFDSGWEYTPSNPDEYGDWWYGEELAALEATIERTSWEDDGYSVPSPEPEQWDGTIPF